MPKDQAYHLAEQKIADALRSGGTELDYNNHPRILFEYDVKPATNIRRLAHQVQIYVTPFVDGLENQHGKR